jgi:hypothetical protein
MTAFAPLGMVLDGDPLRFPNFRTRRTNSAPFTLRSIGQICPTSKSLYLLTKSDGTLPWAPHEDRPGACPPQAGPYPVVCIN